ncbi:hypothetical protein PRUPE_3G125600 [Prunus persica]|uniref:Uncharacterized protein n=1 Tax=Prunus persica TaxID=3760 RepID=A0A251Q2E5_PRUPE|nr:hypothetical protein PRUPE_3G125600 [Prunus persica]
MRRAFLGGWLTHATREFHRKMYAFLRRGGFHMPHGTFHRKGVARRSQGHQDRTEFLHLNVVRLTPYLTVYKTLHFMPCDLFS